MRDIQFLVLGALAAEARHGHAIGAWIEETTGRAVGPGTLYGALGRLEDAGHIRAIRPEGRRRPYALTPTGRARLAEEVDTMARVVTSARLALGAS